MGPFSYRARAARRRRHLDRRRRARRALALWLRRERRRIYIAMTTSMIVLGLAILILPGQGLVFPTAIPLQRLTLFGALTALTTTVYTAVLAGLTHWALLRLHRRELVVTVREARARHASRWIRMTDGGAILLVIARPPGVPVAVLLTLALTAMAVAWYSAVITFALEYASEDIRREAFTMPEEFPVFEEYLYLSWMIQATSAPADVTPNTRTARRLVRSQTVLAYVMNTVVIALGLSALTSAV
jgi:uncharacterized membrane protein